jgi:hypothetical protein
MSTGMALLGLLTGAFAAGTGSGALFMQAWDIAVEASGMLMRVDASRETVRRVDPVLDDHTVASQ